jgi:ankyrin repeat protein
METAQIRAARRLLTIMAAGIACFALGRYYLKSQKPPEEDEYSRLAYWRSMLTNAAQSGNLALFQLMLRNVTPEDPIVPNALFWAGCYGRIGFFRWWKDSALPLKTQTCPNLFDAPLMAAAQHGHKDLTALLAAGGANVNTGKGKDWTPLAHAVQGKRTDIARILLEAGADANTPVSAPTPKMQGFIVFPDGRMTPAPPTFKTEPRAGETPLILAARNRDLATARLLLAKGALANYRSPKGVSAYSVAKQNADTPFLALLKQKASAARR